VNAWCVEPDRQHYNTIFLVWAMQFCTELDTKEEMVPWLVSGQLGRRRAV